MQHFVNASIQMVRRMANSVIPAKETVSRLMEALEIPTVAVKARQIANVVIPAKEIVSQLMAASEIPTLAVKTGFIPLLHAIVSRFLEHDTVSKAGIL